MGFISYDSKGNNAFSQERKVIIMTYFESIGVKKQHSAMSARKANEEFARSCNICCSQGKDINCDKCAIASAHNDIITCVYNQKQERKVLQC